MPKKGIILLKKGIFSEKLCNKNILRTNKNISTAIFRRVDAVKNNQYATWPHLTATNIQNKLPKSIPTIKGRLDQTMKQILKISKN